MLYDKSAAETTLESDLATAAEPSAVRLKSLTSVSRKGSPDSLDLNAIKGLGTAFPEQTFTQAEITRLFAISNSTVLKLMASGHVQKRHLYLPPVDPETSKLTYETPADLHRKFKQGVLDIGVKASGRALAQAGLISRDIDTLIAVTSTGFLVPGVSSLLARALDMRDDVHRLDIVGMGCNAGMSALFAGTKLSQASLNKNVLIVCCEINSASYVSDETVRTGIVNSLFGDGAAAVVLRAGTRLRSEKEGEDENSRSIPIPELQIMDFESFTIPEQHGAMTFTWDQVQNKWSFYLSKDIPFVIGANVHVPVEKILQKHGLIKPQIKHWVLHTGGGAVIDGAKKSLGLSEHDVRHTRSVLRDYGNISSGSFLVNLERLQEQNQIQAGDLGMLIAMGPGATIEAGLVRWS